MLWHERVSERTAALCSMAAGAVWVLQYLHALTTHGPTGFNRAQVALGMTWVDSGKFLVLSFLLAAPAVVVIGRRAARRGHPLPWRAALVLVALASSAVTTAMQFWPADWGSYAGTSAPTGIAYWGGPLQAMSSAVALPLAIAVFGLAAARAGAVPAWVVMVLIAGAVSTFFLAGPLPPVAGVAWLALGGWLLAASRPPRRRPEPAA